MKQGYYWTALFLALIGSGCKENESSVETVKVKTVEIQPVQIKREQGFSGTVEEMTGSALSFTVSGTVKKISVVPGQQVRKGDLIAEIDDETISNAYKAASAVLTQAEDAYARMKQLYDKGSLPEIQWVEIQSQLEQAKAAEQISKKNLDDCKLYAPFSGAISSKNVEPGQNVIPGMTVVKLVTVNPVKIKIAVPENEIARIQIGQSAHIEVSALEGKTFDGRIIEKGIAANPVSRSYEVKASIENPSGELLPGMICKMHISENGEEQEAFILPVSVIQLDENNASFVWLDVAGKARKRTVKTGILTNQGVVVSEGLKNGDRVLVEGWQKVSEDMDIVIEK